MKQEINIAEILKDAPIGTKLWSLLDGKVTLKRVDLNSRVQILVENCEGCECEYFQNGKPCNCPYSQVMLFPSKEDRDWSTFKVSKKPKHFEPFQKVIVIAQSILFGSREMYVATLYSHYDKQRKQHFTFKGFVDDSDILPYEGNEDKLGKVIH